MKNFVITPLASVALGAAALALAGAAAAFPNAGTAADVVSGLKDNGYNVQVNGIVAVSLTCNGPRRPPHTHRRCHARGEAAHPGLRRCVVPLARLSRRRPAGVIASIRA
jgi:hypothetical protein